MLVVGYQMDAENLWGFSSKEEEVADILMEAGLKRNLARVLVLLFKNSNLTSREIERGTDLRQPEVSIAINYLIKQKWACVTSLISEKKGRPIKAYRLATDVNEILDVIEQEKKEEYRQQSCLIERARRVVIEQGWTC